MSDKQLRWGLLATGNIAHKFAAGLAKSRTGKLVAVGSRSLEKAQAFGKEFGCERCHGSYEALLADPEVQAVYISTPHPEHAKWAIAAARAGKHILCEKPLGINHAQAMAIVEAARANHVFLMEAFMYRCHPQTAKLVELLRAKAIGEVRVIKAAFSFQAGFNADSRLFKNDLGGGGILDVGCYCASMARLIAGVANGGTIAEPVEVKGVGHLGQTGVDEWTVCTMKFPGEILASLGAGVSVHQDQTVQIFGTGGWIAIPQPWIPARDGGAVKIQVQKNGQPLEEIVIETSDFLYGLEADRVADNLDKRQGAFPAMTWDDTLGNMRTMDLWRESIGLTYEREKPERIEVVHGGALAIAKPNPMKYRRIAGLDKPVSRIVMGAMIEEPRLAYALYDDFFERGGNCMDTAHIYGGGKSEKVVGAWVRARGIRKDVLILDKGAHTPHCNPQGLTREHAESLQRLGTDYVDLYMMHRDNPDVPVGEFIDVLNRHVKAGTMRVFGVSNWTLDRVDQANAYAQKHKLQGIAAVSNNFSLAEMVDAVWAGCLHNSDPASRAWYAKTQMPLMGWSSQARGFFTDRAGPDKKDDKELARCWYSADNFRRRERAYELAGKLGVEPIAVALAYVLCQPFPTFALIGPRLLSETRTSFEALKLELSPQQLRWLNLEE